MVLPHGLRRPRRALLLAVIACVVVGLGTPGRAVAAAPPPAVQQALDALVADGVPGAIALGREAGGEWRAAAGVANLRTQRPIRPSDRFRIGSMTKAFTATTVLQLAGEGRLSLDDSVERWLPGLVPDGAAITLRQLANHTSGLYDYVDLEFYAGVLRDPLRTWRPAALVRRAVAQPPLFAPGAGWAYSNTNYVLLGLVIAAVDRLPSLLTMASPAIAAHHRIIAPLGLWQTSFPLTNPDIRGRHAHGYAIDPPPEWNLPALIDTTRTDPSWAWAAGAIVSTLTDVADFHRALFTGRLLAAREQRELMTTIPAGAGMDYGLGVVRMQTPCGPAWGHDGSTPSAASISLISPDGSRQAVLALTRDINTWTEPIWVGYYGALFTAFCGEATTAAQARSHAVSPASMSAVAAR